MAAVSVLYQWALTNINHLAIDDSSTNIITDGILTHTQVHFRGARFPSLYTCADRFELIHDSFFKDAFVLALALLIKETPRRSPTFYPDSFPLTIAPVAVSTHTAVPLPIASRNKNAVDRTISEERDRPVNKSVREMPP